MCRPSNTVGPVICTTISPHGTTVLKRSLKPLLTVCACLCPIDTIQCDAFFFKGWSVNFKSGTQSEIFTPRPSIWAKIFNYPSPFLKLVSCIDYFLLIAAQTFHTSSKQARLDMQQFKILSAVILIKQQLQPFTCRTHSNNTYKS